MASQQLSPAIRTQSPVPTKGVRHINSDQPDRFTVVGNHLTQHPDLSLTAIGLAAHIQSLPEGALVSIKVLTGRFPEWEVRIAAALRELEAHGYLARLRERLPSGRFITRTVSYNNPPATRGHVTGETPPRTEPPTAPRTPAPAALPETFRAKAAPRTPGGAAAAPTPLRTEEQPKPEPEPEQPKPSPCPAPVARAPRVPESRPSDPRACDLLVALRRDDPRLLLTKRDVHRLAPAVTTWLERGVDHDAVRRTLTAGLPREPIRYPAALLAHRLAELLPPPLPAAVARPAPFQNCDTCERAFRSRDPGHCRDCRPAAASATAA